MECQYQQPNSRTAEQPNSRTAEVKQISRPINQKRYELNSGLRPPHLRKEQFCLIRYMHQTLKTVIPAKAGIQCSMPNSGWIPAFAGMTEGRNF